MERNSRPFLIVTLGFLSAFAPLVTDMYLPGLPTMMADFGTTASMIQFGITASMIGLAVGQLLVGPISDKYGRRRPLLISLAAVHGVAPVGAPVLGHRRFMRYVMVQSFAMAAMFAYMSSSPFIFQGHFRLSPLVYSFFFAANAFVMVASAFAAFAFSLRLRHAGLHDAAEAA